MRTFPEYLDDWSALHGGYLPQTSFWARSWLRLGYLLARPLAGRVSPNTLTAAGALASAAAVAAAWAGGRWALLAAALVLVTAGCDTVDGAVAVLGGRSSRLGPIWDSLADRWSEAAFAGSLVVVCAFGRGDVAVLVFAVTALPGFLLEYARARAAATGSAGIGVVTVGERPTRVLTALFALLVAGADPSRATVWAGVGAGATAVLGLLGLAGYLRVVRGAHD